MWFTSGYLKNLPILTTTAKSFKSKYNYDNNYNIYS